MVTKLRLVFSITILFMSFYTMAQSGYWQQDASLDDANGQAIQDLNLEATQLFTLQEQLFREGLINGSRTGKANIVYFPNIEGALVPYEVKEKSVLSAALASKYPNIKSYVGHSLRNPENRIRFSISHNGIQTMMVHAADRRNTFMQRVSHNSNQYVVYDRSSETLRSDDFVCSTKSDLQNNSIPGPIDKLVDQQVVRKFRVAISASGEYTEYHGGTVADALGAINATLTRINEVFETDLGVTLELVANNDQVIFTDATTDPYTGNLNAQTQQTLSATIGEANYDLGHLFHEDADGGNAGFIGKVCVDNQKGSAFSAARVPEGDKFDLDFVSHEMGHQLGANHTWSFESEGTLVQAEPASGTTIMGYAGIVAGNNVQPQGDDYFHYNSIFQIQEVIDVAPCAVQIPITNVPPVITPVGDFVIPKSTAFVLIGNATDADAGDILTYGWEQIDNGIVTTATFGPNNPGGANFRSLRPTTAPERYFPKLSSVVQGNLTQTNPATNSAWETVSNVQRDMNFALTVRDNAVGGGQVVSDFSKVSVIESAGPFVVTSQQSNEVHVAGTSIDVTWDVSNTDITPINAQSVDILLSTDGGLTFSEVLATAVPNDGAHSVLLPGTATTTARIMIRASANIFFAVNAANFTIAASEIVLNMEATDYEVCTPDDLTVPFVYETYLGFSEEATFSVSGAPTGLNASFSPATATANDTSVNLLLSNTSGVTPGSYPITVVATTANITKEIVLEVNIYNTNFTPVNLVAPIDNAIGTGIRPVLEWEESSGYTAYDIEIATDATFTSVVESATVIFGSYLSSGLLEETIYYWRVKPKNSCGEGTFGTPFSFTTAEVNCTEREANDLPLAISSTGTPTITSKISFVNDLPIVDVNVGLEIDHTFVSDLVISLTSPAGTTVILSSNSCGGSRNIDATFDDASAPFNCGTNPAITGTVKPLGALSAFNGESTLGEWTLEIKDTAPSDGGELKEFSLEICVEGDFRPDNDGDGVFDDGDDLCLGTPKGVEVTSDGCPIFRFPTDQFSVAVESESCSNNNDGAITVTAKETLDYSLTVIGNGINESADFTDIYALENLVAGTYTLCITGTDGTIVYEEFCFDVVVNEPQPLDVSTLLIQSERQALLQLEGSNLYTIELNGETIQTTASEITVDLKNGRNILKVSTGLPCQGTYDEEIFVDGKPILYPNPVRNNAVLYIGSDDASEVQISIHSLNGKMISLKTYPVNDAEVDMDVASLAAGIYVVRFVGRNVSGTIKLLKE